MATTSRQDFYRKQLFQTYATIPNVIPLAELPDYTAEAPEDVTPGLNAQLANPPYSGFQDSLKLDAPVGRAGSSATGVLPV